MNNLHEELNNIENHPETSLTKEDLDDYLEFTSCDFEIQEIISNYK